MPAVDDAATGVAELSLGASYTEDFGGVIGIDLGTTYSCVAVWLEAEQRTEVFANSEGARTTPSVVAFTETERLIGQPAQAQAAANSANTVYDAKRLIGRSVNDSVVANDSAKFPFKVAAGADGDAPVICVNFRGQDRSFAPEEISAMVLLKMKQTAEQALQKNVKRAVITVPAYFSDAQRNATKNAGAIAGLQVLRIVNEPTAAALAYGLQAKENASDDQGSLTLIFDLGGGTFDVSLLSISDGIFEVKATGGDTHLGGEDFDSAVQDWVLSEFKKKNASALAAAAKDPAADGRAMRRLRSASERAKRMLSTSTTTTIEVDSFCSGLDLRVELSRAKFEALTERFFAKCIDTGAGGCTFSVCLCPLSRARSLSRTHIHMERTHIHSEDRGTHTHTHAHTHTHTHTHTHSEGGAQGRQRQARKRARHRPRGGVHAHPQNAGDAERAFWREGLVQSDQP